MTCYDDNMIPRNLFLLRRFAAAALICIVCGCQESEQIDCQIVGHSMAPTYKTDHSVATCDQCGFAFACDMVGERMSEQLSAVCGNCGAQIEEQPVARPADQVKLNLGGAVRRWDVVAFRRGDRVLVKRVIGLPGETVDFKEGNLIINGRVVPSPKERWGELSTHVFDSSPAESTANLIQLFERLVPRNKQAWSISGTSAKHHPARRRSPDAQDPEFDFLDYRHRRCYKNSEDPLKSAAIDDVYAFNQSIRRQPHRVDELDLRVSATFTDKGRIQIERTTPKGTISAEVEMRDQTIALRLTRHSGGDIKTVENKRIKGTDRSVEVRLVNYDDLICLFIDGQQYVKALRFESNESHKHSEIEASQPVVSIGVSREDSVAIERVSIRRDWHLYQDPPKPNLELPLTLGEESYYVVGGNLPVSEDSRHFGAVQDIIGVVQPVDGK